MSTQTHTSAPRRRVIRAAKHQQAAEAFGPIEPGCEIFCFTFGQFSLIDALAALLDATGPADVTLCTWTAGADSVERLRRLLLDRRIGQIRLIVDRGFIRSVPTRGANCGASSSQIPHRCSGSVAGFCIWPRP